MSKQKNTLIPFFLITFGFSWFFWLMDVLSSRGMITLPFPYMVFVVIGAHGPLAAALILVFQSDGWGGVKALIRSGFKLRMAAIWWIMILAMPPILSGISLWLNVSQNQFQYDRTLLEQPIMIVPTFLMMFFLGGSFQEEFGWRGYALPRLLQRWNPLAASLILGVIWGIWHLPLFYIPGTGQSFMPFGVFLLLTVAFSILFTWFYLRTEGNLFSALLFHTAINTSFSLFPPIEQRIGGNQAGLTYLMIAFAILALVVLALERARFFKTN